MTKNGKTQAERQAESDARAAEYMARIDAMRDLVERAAQAVGTTAFEPLYQQICEQQYMFWQFAAIRYGRIASMWRQDANARREAGQDATWYEMQAADYSARASRAQRRQGDKGAVMWISESLIEELAEHTQMVED